MSTCTLTIVTLDAVKNFFPQVLEGFVSIIRVSFPVIIDKLSYFVFCQPQCRMESMLLSKRFPEGLAPHFFGVNTCWYLSTAVGQVPFPEYIIHGLPEIVLCYCECRTNEEMFLVFCVTN